MSKQTNTSSVKHTTTLPDGRIGCYGWGCESPATFWLDMERYGVRNWLCESWCEQCGNRSYSDGHHTFRVREIKQ